MDEQETQTVTEISPEAMIAAQRALIQELLNDNATIRQRLLLATAVVYDLRNPPSPDVKVTDGNHLDNNPRRDSSTDH